MKSMLSNGIETLIASLTLEEKIKLLGGHPNHIEPRNGDVYGVERVGLPSLKFADGPVGVHWWTKASTCYPALICLAASFDEEMAYRFGAAVGTDCRAFGVHVLLAPGVNLYRSPLCGRNFEYLGEDPELSGKLGAAYIRGVQDQGVSATVKHFAANNQEFDRHGVSSDVDERTLREVYLRPFEMAVKEGNVGCVMTGYNPVNGVHASENAWLIRTVLRKEWGFAGLVMSDWTSVYSTAQSLNAGLDVEMPWGRFLNSAAITPLLASGVLSEETINERIRHRLQLMERFGWLAAVHEQRKAALPSRNPETEDVALEVARNGIVLLKNDGVFLPKPPTSVKRITVLGHHASNPVLCGGGSAYCPPHESITLLDALRRTYGKSVRIDYFEGISLWREREARSHPVYKTPDGRDGLHAEYFDNNNLLGTPAIVRIDERPSFDWIEKKPDPNLPGKHFSVRWIGQFTVADAGDFDFFALATDGEVSVWLDGEILASKIFDSVRISKKLAAGAHAMRIEYHQWRNGWATCHFGFEPAIMARVNYEAGIAAARESDLVLVAAGFVSSTEGEGHDRSFALDPRIDQLIVDASAANPATAVVLYAGGAVDVAPWIDRVKSLLCLWYPGQNGTLAAAEILAGQTNPSGKLPFTWEKSLEDRGSFTCYQDSDGDKRVSYDDGIFTGYRHFDRTGIKPRFAFGHGLSYTTFECENLKLSCKHMTVAESLTVQFDIVNTGDRAGGVSGMIFVGDDDASVARPSRELKATRRVQLQPGERRTVSVVLPPRAFAFWHIQEGRWVTEPGLFTIQAGLGMDSMLEARIFIDR